MIDDKLLVKDKYKKEEYLKIKKYVNLKVTKRLKEREE